MRLKIALALLLAYAGTNAIAPAGAQDWPTRPVTMVVPFAAAGGTDLIARVTGKRLSEILGQQVIIENAPGAGGMLGIVIAILITMLVGALVPSLPSTVPSWALVTGFSVSVVVGVFFGVWPAVKAARLDPVEALRYE